MPAGVFEKPDEVVGRGLVMPVIQNEPILPMKLASKEAGSGLPIMIPEGERAVSVRVNEVIGVAGYVLPGTRVDVVAVASATDNKADTTSKVVLTNVQVLAAGTKMEQDGDQGKPMPVTRRDAARRSRAGRAADAGQHRRQDSARAPQSPRPGLADHVGVRPAGLLGEAPAPKLVATVRARASPGPPPVLAAVQVDPAVTVEMIRGDKRSEEVVR